MILEKTNLTCTAESGNALKIMFNRLNQLTQTTGFDTESWKFVDADKSQMYGFTSTKNIEIDNKPVPLESRIRNLKKQIKHAKSPLEIKQLNQELNDCYKRRKYGTD